MLVLVGGNGFLGRHASELLHKQGGGPAVVVSRSPDRGFLEGFAPSLASMTAQEFAGSAGSDLIARADAVIYFASQSVPSTFAEEPWQEVPANVAPAFELFGRVAALNSAAKIVLLSSGGTVYGGNSTSPRHEACPAAPISGYGVAKLMIEDALRFVGRTKKVPYAILRVSNPVGRWQGNGAQGVVGVALRAARDGARLRLFGGGSQVRDFVDAGDVADAILRASLDVAHPQATWNIGSGVGTKIADLVGQLSQIAGRRIDIENLPSRTIDVPHIVLDCRKVDRDLGWKSRTPIERSVTELWEVLSGNYAQPRTGLSPAAS